MSLIKWVKPSKLEIETNDEKATIEHCEAIGWKRVKAAAKPKAAKKD